MKLEAFLKLAEELDALGVEGPINIQVPSKLWYELSFNADKLTLFPQRKPPWPMSLVLFDLLFITEKPSGPHPSER